MDKLVKVSKAADRLGVSVWTVRRRIQSGTIRYQKSVTGVYYIYESEFPSQQSTTGNRVALYARESSSENRSAMTSQMEILQSYAAAKGWQVISEVREYASGMNDQRPKLHGLISRKDFDILLVENKDRLTRFGFRWFESLAPFRVEVVNVAATETSDLMEDLISIITSFAARLYGQRRGRTKSLAVIEALNDET
jgi:putative resolvase